MDETSVLRLIFGIGALILVGASLPYWYQLYGKSLWLDVLVWLVLILVLTFFHFLIFEPEVIIPKGRQWSA